MSALAFICKVADERKMRALKGFVFHQLCPIYAVFGIPVCKSNIIRRVYIKCKLNKKKRECLHGLRAQTEQSDVVFILPKNGTQIYFLIIRKNNKDISTKMVFNSVWNFAWDWDAAFSIPPGERKCPSHVMTLNVHLWRKCSAYYFF